LKEYPETHRLALRIIVRHMQGRMMIRFQSLDRKQDI